MRLEVDIFDEGSLMGALSHEVPEVLECHLAFTADLEGFFPTLAELFHRASKVYSKVIRGEAENLSHGARDTGAVRVNIIDFCQPCRNLAVETVRKRIRDLLDNISCG